MRFCASPKEMTLPVLNKPPFGDPCNHCGICCTLELCPIAEEHFPGAPLPCPALEYHDGFFRCGMVSRPSYHLGAKFNADEILSPLMARAIGIGQGCGCPDE